MFREGMTAMNATMMVGIAGISLALAVAPAAVAPTVSSTRSTPMNTPFQLVNLPADIERCPLRGRNWSFGPRDADSSWMSALGPASDCPITHG